MPRDTLKHPWITATFLLHFFVFEYIFNFLFSVLPLHKITNGIGLSAEEHVEWMLKDDTQNRDGRINGVNAALGIPIQQRTDA